MRCFFHVVNAHEAILDHVGLETDDGTDLHAIAVQLTDVLRREDPSLLSEARGWQLKVVASSGAVLFTVDIDRARLS